MPNYSVTFSVAGQADRNSGTQIKAVLEFKLLASLLSTLWGFICHGGQTYYNKSFQKLCLEASNFVIITKHSSFSYKKITKKTKIIASGIVW